MISSRRNAIARGTTGAISQKTTTLVYKDDIEDIAKSIKIND